MSQANIDKLERVQNILARVVVGAPRTLILAYWTFVVIYIGYLLVIVLPTNCLITWKTLQPLDICLNSFLTIFHPDACVLPIHITLPDQPVLLATFPLGPFLCLHLLLIGTLYLHTFVLSIPYPPLNATVNSISSPVCLYRLVILCQRLGFVLTILTLYKFVCMYCMYVCSPTILFIHIPEQST